MTVCQIQVNNFLEDFSQVSKDHRLAVFAVAFAHQLRTIFPMTPHERLQRFLDATPQVHPSAFIAPGAVVIGDVTLAEESSVWFQTVLRGDINRIVIGPRSNVQDGAVVHLADDYGAYVGELVTVGHKAILHACTIADEVLDSPRSLVQRQAANRLPVQMAVLHQLLASAAR